MRKFVFGYDAITTLEISLRLRSSKSICVRCGELQELTVRPGIESRNTRSSLWGWLPTELNFGLNILLASHNDREMQSRLMCRQKEEEEQWKTNSFAAKRRARDLYVSDCL